MGVPFKVKLEAASSLDEGTIGAHVCGGSVRSFVFGKKHINRYETDRRAERING